MISVQIGLSGMVPDKTFNISASGIRTLPREILSRKRKMSSVGSTIYQCCFRVFIILPGQKPSIIQIFDVLSGIDLFEMKDSKNFKSHPCWECIVSYLCSPFWSHIGPKA
jgi:hypothetical protein